MAVKRRGTKTSVDSKAIEEFAARAADQDLPVQGQTTEKTETTADRTADSGQVWPAGVPKTLLVRYPDPTIPQMLAELARLDERSQHAIAVRALKRGLDALKNEIQ